jgi:mannose-6-phosphate isomerase-like protein (cupin superfamily)
MSELAWARNLAEFSLIDRGDANVRNLIETKQMVAGLTELKVGAMHPLKTHSQEDEVYLFFSGKGQVTLGDENIEVKADTVVYIPHGVPHAVRNSGEAPLVYLYFGAFIL